MSFVPGSLETEEAENAALERALEAVPRGALALAGTAVGLLLLAWLAIYFFEFLPRGTAS